MGNSRNEAKKEGQILRKHNSLVVCGQLEDTIYNSETSNSRKLKFLTFFRTNPLKGKCSHVIIIAGKST